MNNAIHQTPHNVQSAHDNVLSYCEQITHSQYSHLPGAIINYQSRIQKNMWPTNIKHGTVTLLPMNLQLIQIRRNQKRNKKTRHMNSKRRKQLQRTQNDK